MNLAGLVIKISAVGIVGYFAATSAEDLIAGITDSVSVTTARADMKTFHGKFSEFYTMEGRYPMPGPELQRFLTTEFDSPLEETITDPWGKEYFFLRPKVEIRCSGPDKKLLSRDDLITEYPENRRPPVSRPRMRQ